MKCVSKININIHIDMEIYVSSALDSMTLQTSLVISELKKLITKFIFDSLEDIYNLLEAGKIETPLYGTSKNANT